MTSNSMILISSQGGVIQKTLIFLEIEKEFFFSRRNFVMLIVSIILGLFTFGKFQ